MDQLPDEILANILDFLDSKDVVATQSVSPQLLKLARDNSLWRYKCFHDSPSAATRIHRVHNLAALTGALVNLSLSDHSEQAGRAGTATSKSETKPEARQHVSKRAQAVANWDCTDPIEKVDWYSEYIARHGKLSIRWLEQGREFQNDVRGLTVLGDSDKAIAPLEDGGLCVWDISKSSTGHRAFRQLAQASAGTLFEDPIKPGGPSSGISSMAFAGVGECISTNAIRNKAYVAVRDILNEIDLNTLQLVSQQKYAWPITALSQEGELDQPLTVGTSWALYLYDPRCQLRDRSRSPEDLLRSIPGDPEDSIAFLPNYMKTLQGCPSQPLSLSGPGLSGSRSLYFPSLSSNGPQHAVPARRTRRSHLGDYAHVEPGPLSIIHQGQNEILIAGRFPSILSYDRRYFPRLQYVIHSGARLSTITSIPYPPRGTSSISSAQATLVACGEYGGRGSLELFSLPHLKQGTRHDSQDYELPYQPRASGEMDRELVSTAASTAPEHPFSYKNRQAASTSKLLAVATQGTRIVFSDAEGGLKWVERDGVGLVRRWNINAFELNERGGSVMGEQVVRKIIPLDAGESERGQRGDGDLLIWTGERVGIVSTRPERKQEESEPASGLESQEEQDAGEYSRQMRRALERQADEARWMRRFRLNR